MLLSSDDGIHWHEVSVIYDGNGVNETCLEFGPNGELTALVRREVSPWFPAVCRSSPPYDSWSAQIADAFLQGPMLKRLEGKFLVVGRIKEGDRYRTGLFFLEGSHLAQFGVLPSGGDTSYAGFQVVEPGRAFLSYYSSHEYDDTPKGAEGPAAIYLAELVFSNL